jgi:hypothetical protein
MDAIFLVLLGYWIGSLITAYRFKREIEKFAKEQNVDLTQELQEPNVEKVKLVPFLSIEKYSDELYLFDQKTDVFMCQGKTLEELATNLNKFKQIDTAVVQDGDTTFWFVKGKVQNTQYES